MSDAIIRKANTDELKQIQALSTTLGEHSQRFDNELSLAWAYTEEGEKYYRAKIAGEKGICLVAEKNGEIIGFISGTRHDPDAWRVIMRAEVDNLFIQEKFRGVGIGKLLIDAMKSWAKEQNAKKLILTMFSENKKALSFYKKEGFVLYEMVLHIKIK